MDSEKNIVIRLKHILLIFVLLASFSAFSQNDVSIFGVVRDHSNNKKISGVEITIYQDGTNYSTHKSNSSGKYEFVIGFEHEYKIVYTYPNYVTKYLTIDTRYVPDEEKEGGYEMNIDMTLFNIIEGLDVSILENPIGKAEFDVAGGRMGWDMDYTRKMQAQISALMREHDRKLQEEADRLEKMQQEFNDLVRMGDESIRNKKYSDAVDLYSDALILFPEDEPVLAKKAKAEASVQELLALLEKEKKYNEFIESGDSYFSEQEWKNALSSFESALGLFPDEDYPRGRITEINKKLDDIRQNAASEIAVAKLIEEGDNLVDQDKFDDGISKYTEAIELIPAHKLAVEQIAIAKEKKEAWLVSQEKEVNYANFIAKADEQFELNDFRKSIASYQAALDLKSEEKYPKDQIKKAENILGQVEADREKRAKFDEFVRLGDTKVKASDFQDGINKYKEALVLFPDDQGVKDKIASAESAISGLLAAGEIEKRYQDLISKADLSFDQKKYELSKSTFEQALAVKGNEAYPKKKIAEINGILNGLLAAESAINEKEKKDEFDQLVAQGDQRAIETKYDDAIDNYEEALLIIPAVREVEDKIADAKRKRQDLLANKALDEQYDEWIAKADRSFDTEKYENSKDSYLEALLLFDKDYPKVRIKEIDQILKELALQSSEAEKIEEFAKLEKEGDELVSAEEFDNGINKYDAALDIFPGDQGVIDKKAIAEKKRASLNESMATDEIYASTIKKADAAFSDKSYGSSRRLYQDAFAIKAADYPKNRIKEIDKLLLQIERRKAEEEAAKLASLSSQKDWNSNTSDEEKYIIEAKNERRKSENDSYNDLLAYKAAVKRTNQSYSENGDNLRNENASVIASEREGGEKFFREGEEKHDQKVREANNTWDSHIEWVKQMSEEQLIASRSTYTRLVAEQEDIQRENSYNSDQYKEYGKEIKANKEAHQNFIYTKNAEHNQKIKENYYQSQELAAEQYRVFRERADLREANMTAVRYAKEDKALFTNKKSQEQDDRINNSLGEDEDLKEYMKEQSEDENSKIKENYDKLSSENEMREVEQDRWKNIADVKREQANEEVRGVDYSGEKHVNDYIPGSLAKQYSEGVTEETYEEGNAKIIKRIVVRGNKADEYKMVVMRSGTYYFKNGFSITKTTWNNETEKRSSSMD